MDFMLPFKVGDAAESRSFSPGFRGAWFRCKISAMCIRQGHLECQLEYIDYPDEKKSWTRLYKIHRTCRKQKLRQSREIMVRPPFPQCYWDNEISEHGPKTDVVAIVSGPWKVGDLVDWRYTGCFWTGKIIELLGDDKVKIVCPEIPLGEGGCYDADHKDLRPALDWSLEKGWSVPFQRKMANAGILPICLYRTQVSNNLRQRNLVTLNVGHLLRTTTVMQPLSSVEKCPAKVKSNNTGSSSSDEDIEQSYDGREEVQKCLIGASNMPEEVMDSDVKLPANKIEKCCMNKRTNGEEEPQECMNEASDTPLKIIGSKLKLLPNENSECCMNSQVHSPTSPIAKLEESSQVLDNGQSSPATSKKRKTSTEHASAELPDTVGGAIMELEKVDNKIRWVSNLLLSIGSAPSSTASMPWRFLKKDESAKRN